MDRIYGCLILWFDDFFKYAIWPSDKAGLVRGGRSAWAIDCNVEPREIDWDPAPLLAASSGRDPAFNSFRHLLKVARYVAILCATMNAAKFVAATGTAGPLGRPASVGHQPFRPTVRGPIPRTHLRPGAINSSPWPISKYLKLRTPTCLIGLSRDFLHFSTTSSAKQPFSHRVRRHGRFAVIKPQAVVSTSRAPSGSTLSWPASVSMHR